jgi:hypothetical protein
MRVIFHFVVAVAVAVAVVVAATYWLPRPRSSQKK